MAVDAVFRDPVALLRKETATLDLVTPQTTAREGRRIPLREMNIVARGAGHVGGLKAAAPLQQGHLVAVNIDDLIRAGDSAVDVIIQGLSRHVRK
ncbi:MAG TPA: hypothetical protein VEW46_09420 [Pyrinomonadaceae bacterium]|nr:hypothetical protein [Pyrinomonadaceae bacterium]